MKLFMILGTLFAFPAFAQTLDMSQFAIQTADGQTHYTGYVRSPNHGEGATYFDPTMIGTLPASFDWEAQGVKTPVRDQGSCGSCWAFGSTQAYENNIKRMDSALIDLSEQQIVSCDNAYNGCGGGDFAFDWMIANGQTTEDKFPYTASNARCKTGLPLATAKPLRWGYVGGSTTTPSTDAVKTAIMQYGTIAATVHAGNGWSVNSSGVLGGCGGGTTNHIIAITGWDDAINGGSWRMKNSWGTSWGQGGYAWVKYGCWSIADEAAWITYKDTPTPVTPPVVDLPTDIVVAYNKVIVLAVKAVEGVSYTWWINGAQVGQGATYEYTTTVSVQITVKATNASGTASSTTQVTVSL